MPRERVERLSEVFGNILVQGYGMTEVSSLATVLSKADHAAALAGDGRRLASCGRPVFASEIRVVDDNGRDVTTGEDGEIVFRGDLLMSGYWDAPDLTAATIKAGWLHSGDIGRFDEDGFLYIVDRKKDIIISGGANISGREVEGVLEPRQMAFEEAVERGLVQPIGPDLHAAYLETNLRLSSDPTARSAKVVFTPLHGTGGNTVAALLDAAGFQLEMEAEQAVPDGAFPTVPFAAPNPEVPEAELSSNWRSTGITIGSFVAFAVLLVPAGWIIAGAVVFWGVTVGLGSTRYVPNILIGLAASSVMQIIFSGLLGLSLPPGVMGMF